MAKKDLLLRENIRLNCKEKPKDEVIREIGSILYESGYIEKEYIDGMLQREEVFSTNIGNGIAIPHSVEEGKRHVIQSGIAVMVFPEGTPWNGERVRLVIGIAGSGEDHLGILMNVAETLSTVECVDELITSDEECIYQMFTGEEELKV